VNLQLVEPMLAAVRTGSPAKLRKEEIRPLKKFACGYRLGLNSQKVGCRSIIQDPASCPAKAVCLAQTA
jgi:hypothetical protein